MEPFEIHDARFANYVLANASLETLATGFRWLEGLVWMGDAECLLFQDLPRDRTLRWIEEVGVSVYRSPSQFGNGQARDRTGRLITCSHGARALLRTEYDGTITRLIDRFEGKRLNSPNDVVVKSDGTIWFTDPLYGLQSDYEGGRRLSEQKPAVYRFDPATNQLTMVADHFNGPNGLAFSPDESRLYIAETGDQTHESPKQCIRVFDVRADGTLHGGDIFHTIAPGYCDGLRIDEDGNVWSSAADGVHCIDSDGRLLGKIFVPHRVSNLEFGGLHRNRLFIGGSHTLYAIFLNRRGATWP
jgi:gluconolactonase